MCCCRLTLESFPRPGTTWSQWPRPCHRASICFTSRVCSWRAASTATTRCGCLRCHAGVLASPAPALPASCDVGCFAVPQRLSEVTGGAHAVLKVRKLHVACGAAEATKAVKVVPLSQIRQIQREVRSGAVWPLCRPLRRSGGSADPSGSVVGDDPEPCATPVHHACGGSVRRPPSCVSAAKLQRNGHGALAAPLPFSPCLFPRAAGTFRCPGAMAATLRSGWQPRHRSTPCSMRAWCSMTFCGYVLVHVANVAVHRHDCPVSLCSPPLHTRVSSTCTRWPSSTATSSPRTCCWTMLAGPALLTGA